MAVYDVLPDVNLSTDDIRDTLNANGGNVSIEGDCFSEEANINWCSRYKPVVYPKDFPTKEEYWKGTDGNCGLVPCMTTIYSQIPSLMDGDMNGWEYVLPRGVTGAYNEPLRFGDFRGYAAKALPMIGFFTVPSRASNQFTSASFDATAIVQPEGGNSITLGDLSLSGCYAGVIVENSAGTIKKVVMGDKVSSGTFQVNVPCYDLQAGTYTCYPMLSVNSATGQSGEKYYTLPGIQAKQIVITTSNFTIAVLAERVDTGVMSISYRITITNMSTAVTWTNNAYKLKFFSSKYESPNIEGESSGTLKDTIQVAANGNTIVNGFLNVSTKLWNEAVFTLWVSFNNGAHIESAVITNMSKE